MVQVRRGAVLAPLLVALALPATVAAAAPHHAIHRTAAQAERTVTAFPMAVGSAPFGVTAGPHGEYVSLNTSVGTFDQKDNLTTKALPSDDPLAGWLTTDPSGAIWISERNAGNIGRLSPNGSIVEFPLPAGVDAIPQGTVVSPSGSLYIAEFGSGTIDRLDPSTGHVTVFQIPTADSGPVGLALGPDGNYYFTERNVSKVGRMTPDGTFREWSLDDGAFPNRIVAAPDGAVWFTELFGGKLGRISMAGTLTEYPIDGGPVGITVGEDGLLYVDLDFGKQVARVNLHGTVTGAWDLPGAVAPLIIATGRGQDLWVTDNSGHTVFRLSVH